MNCQEFREGYVVLLDPGSAETAARAELAEHLKSCPGCAQFYDEIARTVALLRPSTQVNASPQFKGNVMDKLMQEKKIIELPTEAREPRRMKKWPLALAAGIAGLLVCGAVLWIKSHPAANAFANIPAFRLFQQAYAAEESLFKGQNIVSIVNEFIVKPISDPALAAGRAYPMNSLSESGKLQYDMLSLPAKPGESYTVEDRAWYDQKTGRFARVMTVAGKAIFANSYDGTSVYRLEPDAAGALKIVSKPVAADFRVPKNPADFLGISAGLTGSMDTHKIDEKQSYFSDAGEATLPDGSAARVVKFTWDLPGTTKELQNFMSGSYVLYTISKATNTIAQVELFINNQSWLVMRRVAAAPTAAPEVPWNLAGIAVQAGGKKEETKPGIQQLPKNAAAYMPECSVQQMAEKAESEAYLFAADPPWTVARHIVTIPDVTTSPPGRGFPIVYCAKDHRHVVLIQTPSYNKIFGTMLENPKTAKTMTELFTSPTGFKVWSAQKGMGAMLLQMARMYTQDPPLADSPAYLIKTPANTFMILAVNGMVSDAELHAMIDSLITAKEYVKKFPEAASVAPPPPAGPPESKDWAGMSLKQIVATAKYETYALAADPPWTLEFCLGSKAASKFTEVYRAKDGRRIFLGQAPDSKELSRMVEGPMAEKMKQNTLEFTSPSGAKAWKLYWYASDMITAKLSQRVRLFIKEPLLPNNATYLLKTAAGDYAIMVVNGALSDAELRALVDGLIPAKEYLKKFPAAADEGAKKAPDQTGSEPQPTVPPEPPQPRVQSNMVLPNVSVQHMVAKADFETYIFSADPPWASKREVTDVLDVASPPQRMFFFSYVAKDHRHVVLVQSPTYNKAFGELVKTGTLAYTSPTGCKVWSANEARSKWLAGILLQSAQAWIKDKPADNRTGYILQTPAGTFPALAINGPVTDAELHALVDSLIPAKEYVKKFPGQASAGAATSNPAGIAGQAGGKQEASEISPRQMVEKAGYETYLFAADPPWTFERHVAITVDTTTNPPESRFMISYRARDGRHVVFNQVPSSNSETPMADRAMKMSASLYTSPNGFKVCSLLNDALARKTLQRAEPWIKDPPIANGAAYLIRTPNGSFGVLAINGALTDAELHALVDSLIPAKEYVKKFPAPAATGAENTGTTSP